MAIPNRISAVLPQADIETIDTALTTITGKLPFLIDLTDAERDALTYLKDKNRQFVNNSFELVNKETGFLPANFSVTEFGKDVALYNSLFTVRQKIASLLTRINDTLAVTGSEAYAGSLAVYDYATANGVSTPGIDPYVDDLSRRFSRKKAAAAKTTTKPA